MASCEVVDAMIVSKPGRPVGFSAAVTRLAVANIAIIAGSYLVSAFFFQHEPRARALILIASLTLWASLPVAIAYYFRSLGRNGNIGDERRLQRILLGAMTVGVVSVADLLLIDRPEGLRTFIVWQVAAAAFSVGSACLAVGRGSPLPVLRLSEDVERPDPD
jgi:hypothetical protein